MTQTGSVSCVRDEAVAAGRMARWLLLACTLLGLAAMHTLGHAAMSMPQHSSHGRSVAVRSGVCPQELVAVNRRAPGGGATAAARHNTEPPIDFTARQH